MKIIKSHSLTGQDRKLITRLLSTCNTIEDVFTRLRSIYNKGQFINLVNGKIEVWFDYYNDKKDNPDIIIA